jgi:hypothetical protein
MSTATAKGNVLALIKKDVVDVVGKAADNQNRYLR